MIVFFYTVSFVAVFLSTWGSQTRGDWSSKIQSIGGVLIFITWVWSFFIFGFPKFLLVLVGQIILMMILSPLLPKSKHL